MRNRNRQVEAGRQVPGRRPCDPGRRRRHGHDRSRGGLHAVVQLLPDLVLLLACVGLGGGTGVHGRGVLVLAHEVELSPAHPRPHLKSKDKNQNERSE